MPRREIPPPTTRRRQEPCELCGQIHERCGAHRTRRRTNGVWVPCRRWPAQDSDACYRHGGWVPRGIAHYAYKTGRYVRSLRGQLLSRYELARVDPELGSLRDEIALIDALIHEICASLNLDALSWSTLRSTWERVESARQQKDPVTLALALSEHAKCIQGGAAEEARQVRLLQLIDQRRKLCDSEAKRMLQDQQYIAASEAIIAFRRIEEIIRRHVSDRDILERIGIELETVAASVDGPAFAPASVRQRQTSTG